MKLPTALLRDTVAVETYSGEAAYGPVYAASATVACTIDQARRLVRSAQGEQVVSELTLLVAAADEGKFTPESRLTIDSRQTTVLALSPKRAGGHTAFVEVSCR